MPSRDGRSIGGNANGTPPRTLIVPGATVPRTGRTAIGGPLRVAVTSAAYVAFYLLFERINIDLRATFGVAPWNPNAGLSLALLMAFGLRYSPLVGIAIVISGVLLYPGAGLDLLAVVAATTTLGTAGAAALLTRAAKIDPRLSYPRDLDWFLAVALVVPVGIAGMAAAAYVVFGESPAARVPSMLAAWWIADGIGLLSIAPLLLVLLIPRLPRLLPSFVEGGLDYEPNPATLAEVAAQVVSIALILWIVYGWIPTRDTTVMHLLFLPLMWIVIRQGIHGASWAVPVINAGAALAPQVFRHSHYSIVEIQVFMLGLSLSGLLVGMMVTERQRTQHSLAISERTKSAILEAVPDLMLRIRADGTYLWYSAPPGLPPVVSPERFLGRTPADVLDPDLARRTMNAIEQTLRTRAMSVFEYSAQREGAARWYESRFVPSGPGEVLNLVRNITDRKKLEADLVQAQKMEAVGQLAAGVAHDFNNLLTAIFAYVGNARVKLPGNDPALSALDGVDAAARQAAGVLRSLLTFSKRSITEFRTVDLCLSVRSAAELVRATLPSSITLLVQTPEAAGRNVPVPVRGDDTQLQQVALNLIMNARDSMPDGGAVRVRVSAEPSPRDREPGTGVLEVIDSGQGIASDDLHRIFEPFFTTKPREHASGLGLAVADGIVKAHGGQLRVDSEVGKGSRFVVSFPLAEPAPDAPSPPAPGPLRSRGSWLLLIDDHRQVREFLASGLSRAGYAVAQAEDPAGVRAAILKHPTIAAVVVNTDMPGETARACLGEARGIRADLPVVALTSAPDQAPSDASCVITKPFQVAQLAGAVERLIMDDRPSMEPRP